MQNFMYSNDLMNREGRIHIDIFCKLWFVPGFVFDHPVCLVTVVEDDAGSSGLYVVNFKP